MKKFKNYEITVFADESALAIDTVIGSEKMNGGLPFEVVFQAENRKIRAYVDEIDDENDFGRVESIKDKDTLSKVTEKDFVEDLKHSKVSGTIVDVVTEDDDEDEMVRCIVSVTVEYDDAVTLEIPDEIPADLAQAINEKVGEGVITLEEATDKVMYMLKNYCDKRDIKDVIAYWHKQERPSSKPTEYVDPLLKQEHEAGRQGVVGKCIQSYLMGFPKILKGPKSTGKNTLINTIVWLFGDYQFEHTCTLQDSMQDYFSSEMTDNSASERVEAFAAADLQKADLIRLTHPKGTPLSEEEKEVLARAAVFEKLKAQCASVKIVHEYRAFAKWIIEGGVMVMNEINMADANLLVGLLHDILDGSIQEKEVPGMGFVPLDKPMMLFATKNCGYAGEQEGNPATESRMGAFVLGQPDSIEDILKSAVKHKLAKLGINDDLDAIYYRSADMCYRAWMKGITQGSANLSDQCLNIRGFVRALVLTKRFEGRTTLNENIFNEVVCACPDSEHEALLHELNASVAC